MKTKFFTIVLAAIVGLNFLARSDEGLWLPLLVKDLNYEDMKRMGLNLSSDEIYSINHSSLKDAIVQFSDYSSGSVISPDGLIITSHNSGLDYIRSHSNIQNDYVTNGFWAMSEKEELANPGLTVTFLVRMENVTKKVLSKLKDDMDEQTRIENIEQVCAKIESRTVGKTHYTAEVKSFCNDMEFFLFVYETFNDVRLVGAPPFSIGKYGGDQDNWKWPRHTGDFSLFRIYTGHDGKPAEFSEDNIPLKLLLSCKEKEKEINTILEDSYLSLNRANRLFKEGLKEMHPEKSFYCDANSSMRLSYGKVLGCEPMDGTVNKHYTTLSGVMEKSDPADPEYFVPEKLIELYQEKDYGDYSENDIMNVCFISNNDVTGGSAGSPVINGDGQMVGLVFDLNWEGMSGDLCYEPSVNRTINVDMRYVLFIIDKFANAKHLVDEMTVAANYKLVY